MKKIRIVFLIVINYSFFGLLVYSQSDSSFYILNDVSYISKTKSNVWINELHKSLNQYGKEKGKYAPTRFEDIISVSNNAELALVNVEYNDVKQIFLISLINGNVLYNFKSRIPFFDKKNRIFFIEDGYLKELVNFTNIISSCNLSSVKYDRFLLVDSYLVFSQNITEFSDNISLTNHYLNLNSFDLKPYSFNTSVINLYDDFLSPTFENINLMWARAKGTLIEKLGIMQSLYYNYEISFGYNLDSSRIDILFLQEYSIYWVEVDNKDDISNEEYSTLTNMGFITIPNYYLGSIGQKSVTIYNGELFLIPNRKRPDSMLIIELDVNGLATGLWDFNEKNLIFYKYKKVDLLPYKTPYFSNSIDLIFIDLNGNIYLLSSTDKCYDHLLYKLRYDDEGTETNDMSFKILIDNYKSFYKNQTNELRSYCDSVLYTKTNFDNPYDLYLKMKGYANKQEILKNKYDNEIRLKILDKLAYDTIPLNKVFISELYSLDDQLWQIYISSNNYNIPLKLNVSADLAKRISKADNKDSYWIITKSFSLLSLDFVPIKAEFIFENKRIYKQIIPEYSYQMIDNLSFFNNYYKTETHSQISDSNIYSFLVVPGMQKSIIDYSNGLNVKNVNDRNVNISFNDEHTWFLNDKLLMCCPKQSDYRDGNDGIGIYFDNTGYALNVNLPWCEGNRVYLIDNSGSAIKIKEGKDCYKYWRYSHNEKISIEPEFNYDNNRNTYTKGVLHIKSTSGSSMTDINILELTHYNNYTGLGNSDKPFSYYHLFSPNDEYFALLVNQYVYIYSCSTWEMCFQIELESSGTAYVDANSFYNSNFGKLYWDATSSFLGINNLLFQIPILIQIENNEKYRNIIEKADLQFKNMKYEAAFEIYNSALKLKKEESYPIEQIKKIEPILTEIRKKELAKIAIDKGKLISNNEIFIQNKDKYGKYRQLFKSVTIAYDPYKNDLLIPFNKLIDELANEKYTNVTIENIEFYIETLNSIIKFQEKIRKLIENEDLSILQKDLKNLSKPKEIINRIMAE